MTTRIQEDLRTFKDNPVLENEVQRVNEALRTMTLTEYLDEKHRRLEEQWQP